MSGSAGSAAMTVVGQVFTGFLGLLSAAALLALLIGALMFSGSVFESGTSSVKSCYSTVWTFVALAVSVMQILSCWRTLSDFSWSGLRRIVGVSAAIFASCPAMWS